MASHSIYLLNESHLAEIIEDLAHQVCKVAARHLERAGLDPELASSMRQSAQSTIGSRMSELRLNNKLGATGISAEASSSGSLGGKHLNIDDELDRLTNQLLEPMNRLIEAAAVRQRLWLSTRSALKQGLVPPSSILPIHE